MHQKIYVCTLQTGFRSVAVITFALHAKGPQLETSGGVFNIHAEIRYKVLTLETGEGHRTKEL